ncbi:hypothetical protein CFP56_000297 [Quercus suber]|uniref:Exo_endo_phos domain-containing protein n=1 Tax=Quercus suber TaxID=58331 RepID=A0AAW0MF73_QUESU
MEFNKNLIAIKVSDALCDWVMVGFYDPSYLAKKQKAWENLMAFINSCLCPWVCIGDFNFTNNDKEIFGGNRSGESSAINYLKEFIFEFSAIDLGFSGNSYTWARGRWGSSAIKRRLDRGIASILWRLAFPSAAMAHLGAFKSNHTPILLDTNPKDSFAHRPFRFEAAWIRDSGCNSIVEKAWNVQARGPTFFKLLKKQANTRDALRKWNKEMLQPYSPFQSLTPLGKISSSGYPLPREFSLSNQSTEWRSPTLAMGIKTCPIGRLCGRQGCRSVLKCCY